MHQYDVEIIKTLLTRITVALEKLAAPKTVCNHRNPHCVGEVLCQHDIAHKGMHAAHVHGTNYSGLLEW